MPKSAAARTQQNLRFTSLVHPMNRPPYPVIVFQKLPKFSRAGGLGSWSTRLFSSELHPPHETPGDAHAGKTDGFSGRPLAIQTAYPDLRHRRPRA